LQRSQWKESLRRLKALSSSESSPCFALSWKVPPVEGGGDVDKESSRVSSLWLWGDYVQGHWVNNWTKPTFIFKPYEKKGS